MMYMDENSIRRFDAEVDKLTADNYGKKIIQKLCSYGTSDIGYRLGGTWAERKAADYVVKEFRNMGIQVKTEAIPTDSFDLKGAWITINGRKITGSQIAGFRGTPEEGLTAQVVYVGTGTRAEYEACSKGEHYYDDKIVLVDNVFDTEWIGWQSSEATVQGALGMILTSAGRENEVYFSYADDMITGQDGQNMVSDVPLLYIPKKDGDWIKSALCESDEPVVVNMCSIVDITKAEDGGTGYNVIAEIPGKSGCNEEIMFCAHMDAHLRAAGDDTGALATVMTIAKAMKLSGYEPDYTVKFFITSSEEYGIGNTMYDWQHGAFYAFAKQHPEWSGKIAAMFNYEVMPEKNGVLEILSEQELCGNMMEWLEAMKKDEMLPSFPENTNIIPSVITVGDNWSATAAGVPSMCMVVKAPDYMTRYHSNYDREENLDYEIMRDMAKASFRMYLEYDKGIIPYSLGFRANDLSGLFNDPQMSSPQWGAAFPMTAATIAANGGDERVIAEMKTEIERFVEAAEKWENSKAEIPEAEYKKINSKLVEIATKLSLDFTCLGAYQNTVYPYQQTLSNLIGLNEALAELRKAEVDKQKVIDGLFRVNLDYYGGLGLLRTGSKYSRETYYKELELFRPKDSDWSGLGNMTPYIDVYPEYELLIENESLDYNSIITSLEAKAEETVRELNSRLEAMIETLKSVTSLIETMR